MNPKKYLRLFLFNFVALWATAQIIEGIFYTGGIKTLLLSSLALTVINLLVKPLIKLLFLPINLLTMGAFRWLVNVIALYLVTTLVPQFQIGSFIFNGFTFQGFIIPSFNLNTFAVYILISFLISIITSFIFWLIK